MPDLGRYAGPVLGAYAAAILLLAILIAVSLWQAARARRALRAVEERQGQTHG